MFNSVTALEKLACEAQALTQLLSLSLPPSLPPSLPLSLWRENVCVSESRECRESRSAIFICHACLLRQSLERGSGSRQLLMSSLPSSNTATTYSAFAWTVVGSFTSGCSFFSRACLPVCFLFVVRQLVFCLAFFPSSFSIVHELVAK